MPLRWVIGGPGASGSTMANAAVRDPSILLSPMAQRATGMSMKWHLLVALLSVVLGTALVGFLFQTKMAFLNVGVVCEVLGLWKTLTAMNDNAKAFGRPGFWERLLAEEGPRIAEGGANVAIGPFTVSGRGWVGQPTFGTPSVVDRLTALEKKTVELEQEIAASNDRSADLEKKLKVSLAREKTERQSAILEVRAKLEEVTVDGLDDEYPWIVVLLWGLLLTNYNEWLAEHLSTLLGHV